MSVWHRPAIHLLCALCASGAALAGTSDATKALKVQLVDAGVLAAPASNLIVAHTPAQVAASELQPAPLPNPDAQAPNLAGAPSAGLNPALLSRKLEFQGNGFANFSSLDYAIDDKTKPAAGLNLSVPVK